MSDQIALYFLCEPSLSNNIKTQNNVLGKKQQTKKKTFYLDSSVLVLTLDMSFDAAANNNCLLQLNVPTRDRAECTVRPEHWADKGASQTELTGPRSDEIWRVRLTDKLTKTFIICAFIHLLLLLLSSVTHIQL